MNVAVTISPRDYGDSLFDLDRVLITTAIARPAAWKTAADIGMHQDATGDTP